MLYQVMAEPLGRWPRLKVVYINTIVMHQKTDHSIVRKSA